ncbi:MAG: hypothetical protein Q4A83_07490 [Bacillota bacterium]|nr:hypothetical protein [Bacillota bacterium]
MSEYTVRITSNEVHGCTSYRVMFSASANKLLADISHLRVKITPSLVYFMPANAGCKLTKAKTNYQIYCGELQNRVSKGKYKMLKCGNGFAIRRYEPIAEGATK